MKRPRMPGSGCLGRCLWLELLWIVSQSMILYVWWHQVNSTCDVIKMYSVPVTPSLHHYGINIGQEKQVTACHWLCMRTVYDEWNTVEEIITRARVEHVSHNAYIYCPKCFHEMHLSCWTHAVKTKKASCQQTAKIALGLPYCCSSLETTLLNKPFQWTRVLTFFFIFISFFNKFT